MDRAKLSAGIAYNQIASGEPALWAEYRQRYIALVAHRCATGFLKYGAERSFGKPAKYAYLEEAPACWVVFTMRSARKAAVEIWGHNGSLVVRHRLTLRSDEGERLIARVEYGHDAGEDWHVDHFV